MSKIRLTKAEKRQQKMYKEKHAPKGATLADQLKKTKISKGYGKNSSKKTKVKISLKK
ncbi:hypothetical protein KKF32_00865 [Patescibacteria group bacterium]|nr:hypothetical protein [Patescibacteria group bacterium]